MDEESNERRPLLVTEGYGIGYDSYESVPRPSHVHVGTNSPNIDRYVRRLTSKDYVRISMLCFIIMCHGLGYALISSFFPIKVRRVVGLRILYNFISDCNHTIFPT